MFALESANNGLQQELQLEKGRTAGWGDEVARANDVRDPVAGFKTRCGREKERKKERTPEGGMRYGRTA